MKIVDLRYGGQEENFLCRTQISISRSVGLRGKGNGEAGGCPAWVCPPSPPIGKAAAPFRPHPVIRQLHHRPLLGFLTILEIFGTQNFSAITSPFAGFYRQRRGGLSTQRCGVPFSRSSPFGEHPLANSSFTIGDDRNPGYCPSASICPVRIGRDRNEGTSCTTFPNSFPASSSWTAARQ